jgi:hypothetical protein
MICMVLFERPWLGWILDVDEWHPGPHSLEFPNLLAFVYGQGGLDLMNGKF